MKNYTKQITAFAVLSLIAYSANAQSATFNWDQQNNGTGPTSGMTIAPAAPGVIPDVSIDAGIDPIDNVVATTAVVDPILVRLQPLSSIKSLHITTPL